MTLDELKEELKADLPIKLTAVQTEVAENPVLYGKWNRYLADINREITRLDAERKKMLRDRFMFYTGRSEDEVCMDVYSPTELKTVIAGDEEVIKKNAAVELSQAKADFCRQSMEAVRQRGFSLRAIIDCRKLEAGE
ncbi:UvsY recombination, repair and single-stranded DNA binding protein [Aeromonas phage Aeh1]|uniref:UvsY recombination, repair and single-stranded DNA binding protein n=1 Tax=Aeromonas phage Aeh1 TaxID=2880362 RepID=Q76YJ0_9CAUD|nr:UvsY-like recombination mediator [Aeromonas phage Aeh1]AAQ17905.1 UvsY recombination, repair and single-stranded DNA binding protein [Aeromonas phage Aeh1]